ncbi:MAG: GNAT family N-acetyltransferase [Spirochaetia bacterium]
MDGHQGVTILQAAMPEHHAPVRDLFAEYLRWVCARIYDEYKAVFDAESMIVSDMQKIGIFLPPQGILLIALEDGRAAGCACTRTIEPGVAEMKRMYVRPSFRRRGIGKALVQQTIETTRKRDFAVLRLDSAEFMHDAHALYRSFGFEDIPPYSGSEIPVEYRKHWVFMELNLSRK